MNRLLIVGFVGILAIVFAVGLIFLRDADEEQSLQEGMQTPQNSTKPIESNELSSNEELNRRASDKVNVSRPKENQTDNAPIQQYPSFDVVRVNPAGDAVIAGRALPGSEVTLLDGNSIVATVISDRNGEWVVIPNKPLPSGNRTLSLRAKLPNGEIVYSEDIVVLAVPDRAVEKERALAVLVPREGKNTRKVLQFPKVETSNNKIGLTVDVIDYDDVGNLRLMGQANPGNTTMVYLNNIIIGKAIADANGSWELKPLGVVDPGVYTLRVDELSGSRIVKRIELPFSRAEPLAAAKSDDFVIVQPGNSLWRISRKILGKGLMYSVIYEANRDQIRDPDLIYPGQIFAVPKEN